MALWTLLANRGNPALCDSVARSMLGAPLDPKILSTFPNGEIHPKVRPSVRDHHVIILASSQPPGDRIVEIIGLIDGSVRGNARRVTVFFTHYGYARSDRKHEPGEAIMSAALATAYQAVGGDDFIILDPHAPQIQGFFKKCDVLYARPYLIQELLKLPGNLVLVSPDSGANSMVRSYSKRTHLPRAVCDKDRPEPSVVGDVAGLGEFADRDVVFIDDMIDTAGTLLGDTEYVLGLGARSVSAVAVFSILSKGAAQKLADSPIRRVITTNAHPIDEEDRRILGDKLQVVDLTPLIISAITACRDGHSMSALLEKPPDA